MRNQKYDGGDRSEDKSPVSVDTGTGILSTMVFGSGPPLLMLHGLTANRSFWDPLIPLVVGRAAIVAPDLLGRGHSAPPAGADYSLSAERDRILALIGTLGLDNPLIVGHSYGASVALAVAGAAGSSRHRPCGLLLLSPITPWTARPRLLPVLTARVARPIVVPLARVLRRPLTRYVLERRVLGAGRRPSSRLVDDFSSGYATSEGIRALLDVLGDWRPSDLSEWTKPPTVPVRVLAGNQDRRISAAETRRLAERLGAPLRFVPEAGHGLTLDAPSEVARALAMLLDDTGR